jgi:hypothetical protein
MVDKTRLAQVQEVRSHTKTERKSKEKNMTEEGIIRMAREIFDVTKDGRGRETFSGDSFGIERMAALVAAIEREECAKVCDDLHPGLATKRAAEIIRARGSKT